MEASLELSRAFSASITILHVMDPYLKQFYNDIYAQGRREYLEHVDDCLKKGADLVRAESLGYFKKRGADTRFITRYGDPHDEIIKEAQTGAYDLLILGGKVLSGLTRFRSWNLPSKIERAGLEIPVMIVRSRDEEPVPR